MSNSLYPDQAGHFVGPDLNPNCLQRLSADDKSPAVHDMWNCDFQSIQWCHFNIDMDSSCDEIVWELISWLQNYAI